MVRSGLQVLCGGPSAVGSYRGGEGAGAVGDAGFQGLAECAGQRAGRRQAARVRDPDPEVVDAPGPVVLVVLLGKHDLWHSGHGGRGGGARAAVVHDGGDPAEKRLVVGLSEHQAVGCLVRRC